MVADTAGLVAEWAGKEEEFHGRVFWDLSSFALKSTLVCIAFSGR